MNRLEYFIVFDADGGKLIDVEEATPIDFVVGGAPPHQPVMLAVEQFAQALASRRGGRIKVTVKEACASAAALAVASGRL